MSHPPARPPDAFASALAAVRVAFDEYARARSDTALLDFINACSALREVHDGGALDRSLERRRLAQLRAVGR